MMLLLYLYVVHMHLLDSTTVPSLEVSDHLPKEMGEGLDQLLIKPSSKVGIVT